jgi:hypothetical protein
MFHIDDPAEMTPAERLREVAALLAQGFLRLKSRPVALSDSAAEPAEPEDSSGKIPCNSDQKTPLSVPREMT